MRFTLPYNWYRFMGITGISLLLYCVVIGLFGNVDISGYLPMRLAASIQMAWPEMPFFSMKKEPVGGGQEIYYTVPTRQLTPQEVAQMSRGGSASGLTRKNDKPADLPADAPSTSAR